MHTTTPRTISRDVEALCRELVDDPRPQFLLVTPVPNAKSLDCFTVIERQIKKHGGAICYGWQIWEWPTVMIEAEFHAVWRNRNGELRDLTPKQLPVQRILFLPDPVQRYDGRQVKNVRRPLSVNPRIAAFINACNAEFELMNRGVRAYQHGAICLEDEEAQELVAIRRRKAQLYSWIVKSLPRPGRNDPCPCGSGKKFKKCCGR